MNLSPIPEKSDVTGEIFALDESVVERLSVRNSKQGLSENTKQAYLSAIRDFNRFLATHDHPINKATLMMYFHEIREHLAASTLNLRKYALLKVIKAQLGAYNTLKEMAIEKAFEQIPTYKTESACRVSEALNIRLRDCQAVGENMRIQVFGKGNKARTVVIPLELYAAIRDEYQGKQYLFESKGGNPLIRQNVLKQVKRAGRKLGLNISPHTMRHSRATDIHIHKGISLTATSRLLGHADPSITAKMYVHDQVDYAELFARDRI
jgi:integrase